MFINFTDLDTQYIIITNCKDNIFKLISTDFDIKSMSNTMLPKKF